MTESVIIKELIDFFIVLWDVTKSMAPYLLFGFFVAGVLSVAISPGKVESHLGGKGLWPVLKAALFGVPLPLCSCSVIPVATSLRKHGATAGATTAFIISTPQTGIDSFLVTFSLLGTTMAVFRPVIAFISGLIGGSLVTLFHLKTKKAKSIAKCDDPCCATKSEQKKNVFYRIFHYGFVVLPKDLVKSLIIGLFIAGLITTIIPDDFFSGFLGSGISGMFLIMLVSIPVYVCATASVPIALALIAKGVSPGTALVFLMAGPATNAATITTIWNIMGKYAALLYLTTVGISAIVSGLVFDHFFAVKEIYHAHHGAHFISGEIHTLSAIILGLVFIYSFKEKIFGRFGKKHGTPGGHIHTGNTQSGQKSCSCE